MKSNFGQAILMGISVLLVLSCKKNIDQPIIANEPATSAHLSGHQSATPQIRPFKGQIVGSFVSTPTSNPDIYNSVANATGNVTHLGVFSKITSDVVNIVSSTLEGTFVMTSPGGEKITGWYSGALTYGTTPGTFSWVLNATITGGTGRFLSAWGEFVFVADANYTINDDIVSGNYTETFDGTIVY